MIGIRPVLVVVTDVGVAPAGALEERVEAVLAPSKEGTVMVQLRDKGLPARRRFELARRLVALSRTHRQWFVVNDRLDMASLLDADGVHLGEGGVETADARRLLSPGAWISRACHDASAVLGSGADAVLLSPIAAARKGNAALGIPALTSARNALARAREADSTAPRPLLYALGGIDATNAAACLAAGADGVAVVGAALDGRPIRPLLDALSIAK